MPERFGIVRSVLRNPLGIAAIGMLAVIIGASLLAPVLAPFAPTAVRIELINAPPGGDYLLGGDGSGRDILSRLFFSGRNTLAGALVAVAVALALGVSSGLIAGYFGRVCDTVASWTANVLLALPAMIVLLALFTTLGSSVFLSMAVFGVMLAPGFFRLVRGLVIGVKNELYVDAARVSGLSNVRIIGRHILLVVRAPVVIHTSIMAGIAIVIQSGLEFLGLGDPGVPTWGGMLQDAFSNIYVAPTATVWPGLAIAITVAAFVLLGNAVRDGMQRTSDSPAKPSRRNATIEQSAHAAPVVADEPAPESLLRVRDLVVSYPAGDDITEVVRGVDLDVRKGEVLGLVGESGSGKTQTAFAILGLLGPGGSVVRGRLEFGGTDLNRMTAQQRRLLRGRRIGYIPQEPMSNLDPAFRVGTQLTEPLRSVMGLSRAAATQRALELLARVGIPEPERTFRAYPHEISGGMAQRVLIAGAVSCDPDLLIADEPTTALDVTVQAEVLDLLRDLQRELSMGMVLVTHNFGVVADICERVAVMRDGQIVETNDVRSLFAAPRHAYTRMLLASTLEDSEPRHPNPAMSVGAES